MARKLDTARRADLATRAVAALREIGVHRCTMSDLALALGMKRPTLYFYFRDLGSVFDVVFEDTQRRYLEHVARRVDALAHPIDTLIAIARATAEFQAGQRETVVLLFQLWAVGGTDPERVLARGRELFEPSRRLLIEGLTVGVAAGQVVACDPARVVDLVLATLDGAMVGQVTRHGLPQPVIEEMIARVLEPLAIRVRVPRGRDAAPSSRASRSSR